jgi:hypothetical protein
MGTTSSATERRDPFSPGTQKLSALSGIGFAVLLIIAFALTGAETPDFADPVADWTKYAADNDTNMRIGTLVVAFAVFMFVWFMGFLRSELRRAEEAARGFSRLADIAFAGGLIGIAGLGVTIAMGAGAVQHAQDTPPEIIRAITEASSSAWILTSAGFGALMIATGLLTTRIRGLVPSWLAVVALISGALWLLQTLTFLSEEQDNFFGMAYPLALLTLLIWLIGSGVAFVQRTGR